jgi:tetratricopeptide (TPR) repeat protein
MYSIIFSVVAIMAQSVGSTAFNTEKAWEDGSYRDECFRQLCDSIVSSEPSHSQSTDAIALYDLGVISRQADDTDLAESIWRFLVDESDIPVGIGFEAAQYALRFYQSHAEVTVRERASFYLEKAIQFAPRLKAIVPDEYPHIILDLYIMYPEIKWATAFYAQENWQESIKYIERAINRYPEVVSKLSIESLNEEKVSRYKLLLMLAGACEKLIHQDNQNNIIYFKEKLRTALEELIREDATTTPLWTTGPIDIYLASMDYERSDEAIIQTAAVFASQNLVGGLLLGTIANHHILLHRSGNYDIQKQLFYKYCDIFKSTFVEKYSSMEEYHGLLADGARLAVASGNDEIIKMIHRETGDLSLCPPEIQEELRALEVRFAATHFRDDARLKVLEKIFDSPAAFSTIEDEGTPSENQQRWVLILGICGGACLVLAIVVYHKLSKNKSG